MGGMPELVKLHGCGAGDLNVVGHPDMIAVAVMSWEMARRC